MLLSMIGLVTGGGEEEEGKRVNPHLDYPQLDYPQLDYPHLD